MKPLQQSCAKLKLRTGLATRATYLKLRPQHPVSVESYCLRQERVNKHLKRTLEFDSTAAVRPSQGCSHHSAASSGGCEGRAPPGPDPHTTVSLNALRTHNLHISASHSSRPPRCATVLPKKQGQLRSTSVSTTLQTRLLCARSHTAAAVVSPNQLQPRSTNHLLETAVFAFSAERFLQADANLIVRGWVFSACDRVNPTPHFRRVCSRFPLGVFLDLFSFLREDEGTSAENGREENRKPQTDAPLLD